MDSNSNRHTLWGGTGSPPPPPATACPSPPPPPPPPPPKVRATKQDSKPTVPLLQTEKEEEVQIKGVKRKATSLLSATDAPSILPSTKPFNLPFNINIFDKSPWTDYDPIYTTDMAGSVEVAVRKKRSKKVVAIKRVSNCARPQLRNMRSILHEHILALLAAYFDHGNIFLVYEKLKVCLGDVVNISYGQLRVTEMATICQGVLNGVAFIHHNLNRIHGSLSLQTILIDAAGVVKLANVGELFLNSPMSDIRHDLSALGTILRDLLEPQSSLYSKAAITKRAKALKRIEKDRGLSRSCLHSFVSRRCSGRVSMGLEIIMQLVDVAGLVIKHEACWVCGLEEQERLCLRNIYPAYSSTTLLRIPHLDKHRAVLSLTRLASHPLTPAPTFYDQHTNVREYVSTLSS